MPEEKDNFSTNDESEIQNISEGKEKAELDKLVNALKEKEIIIKEKEQEITGLKIERVKLMEQLRKESEVLGREAERKANKSVSEIILAFLEIMDNFERAIESLKNENSNSKEGIALIKNQIEKLLASYGVKEIDLADRLYDPNLCEIGELIETDEAEPNKILKVLRKGYYMNDKLLRTAVVSVAVPKNKHDQEVE